ncbi:trypsin-like peptidase domain-containing protein [Actinoplanes auranticolor]|uniref:Trypsin-like peptidase n=1 Tax=Actinoplanes auranticolor TaxID=47988 RepID=A0A919S5C5_9ACTN|nr:serine protease [Actinoplanes auranticolor]GIM63019.1 hypothetical protein Aau02nite_01330 [Actinoplanes auranticolor]
MSIARDRVVAVQRASRSNDPAVGSGYLIAQGLVLTAEHIVGRDDAAITVTALDGRASAAQVAWRAGGDRDIALLSVDDPQWPATRIAPVPFGRTISGSERVETAAIGFPIGQRTDDTLDTRQYQGFMSAGTAHFAPVDQMDVTAGASFRGRRGSPHYGASGAAVACADSRIPRCDAILGVIVEDRGASDHSALGVAPVWPLADDPEFRDVFRRHAGRPPIVEPVELSGALLPRFPSLLHSPASLLLPESAVASFDGRGDELARLQAWCDGPAAASEVFVVQGPGGAGKTRLARELLRLRTEQGWTGGFLDPDSSAEFPDIAGTCIRTAVTPLLLVIDYAETVSPARLSSVFSAAKARIGTRPLRLLLLTRAGPSWLTAPPFRMRLDEQRLIALPPLYPTVTERHAAFRRCAREFALRLSRAEVRADQPPDAQAIDWPVKAAQLAVRHRPLDAYEFSDALTLQMTVLTDLLPRRGTTRRTLSIEADLLQHESAYLDRHANRRGLGLDPDTLRVIVLASVLFGADSEANAKRLLRRLSVLSDVDGDRLHRIVAWLTDLYPRTHDAYLQPMRPERLGESLIIEAERTGEAARLITTLAPYATAGQLDHCEAALHRAVATYDVTVNLAEAALAQAIRPSPAPDPRPAPTHAPDLDVPGRVVERRTTHDPDPGPPRHHDEPRRWRIVDTWRYFYTPDRFPGQWREGRCDVSQQEGAHQWTARWHVDPAAGTPQSTEVHFVDDSGPVGAGYSWHEVSGTLTPYRTVLVSWRATAVSVSDVESIWEQWGPEIPPPGPPPHPVPGPPRI